MTSPKSASAERQATLLAAGARAAKNFASILDFNEIMQKTVDIICDEFDFYYAGVFMTEPTGKWAVLKAGRGDAGKAMLDAEHKLEIGGNSMIGDCIANKDARISLDVGEEAVFFKNPHLPDTRSEMGLPLIVGDTTIGALTVQSVEEAAFTQEDIAALQAMADQLAIAIDNAKLHQNAQRRAKYFEAANQVGRNLSSILDLDELLPKTVDVIVAAYNFYYAGVFLVDAEGKLAVLKAGHGKAGKAMMDAGHKLEVGGNSMIGDCVANRVARISLDVGEEAVFFKNPHLPNTRSEMALPLVVGAEVLGAVTVQSEAEAAFSEEDISTLQTMADHLAVAIRNAYSLRELEAAHAELLRQKTYEALATATTQAIHWIGNKALPITTTIARMYEVLEEKIIDVESMKEDLEMIDVSAQLIVKVKESLLGPAREHQPTPVMVGDIAASAAVYTKVPNDKFSIEINPDTPYVMGDPTQLTRVFNNLYANSLEANAGKITVTVAPSAEGVSITVADDGDGIAFQDQERIWAAFITTKGLKYNGLGLPACLHVITQHEGVINLESKKGGGTTFTITLPSIEVSDEGDLGNAPKNIVIIDDNDHWAEYAKAAFSDAGKSVTLQSGTDKLDKADLILVDDALTAAPITDILAALEEKGLHDKTIVVAAGVTVERTQLYMKHKIKDLARKPYTKQSLANLFD